MRWLAPPRSPGAFGVLMYHRVAPRLGGPTPTWNVEPHRFGAQLVGLLKMGYEPWPLRRVLAAHRAGQPIPRRAFVVTFDDGYENIHTWAWPILRELKIPATVFVATAYLDQTGPFPFDDWNGAGSSAVPSPLWRPLTTAQCSEMLEDGLIEIGSHTHTHQVFWNRPEELFEDAIASLDVLRGRFGLEDATFAFPYGLTAPNLAHAIRRAGLLCALTVRGEVVRPHDDAFEWGRFAVEQSDTAGTLAAQLDGWCSLARPAWKRLADRGLTAGTRPAAHESSKEKETLYAVVLENAKPLQSCPMVGPRSV